MDEKTNDFIYEGLGRGTQKWVGREVEREREGGRQK